MSAMPTVGPPFSSFFQDQLPAIAARIDRLLGLHFPGNRTADLKNAFAHAAGAFGYENLDAFASWFLTHTFSSQDLAAFAAHFTIGETYFFRETETLHLLENRILPELLKACERAARPLRIWSAGCSTGEEAYTLAILLNRIVPDPANRKIEILGTDINPHSLDIARKACYSAWAFRGLDPLVRQASFQEIRPGHYQLVDTPRKRVRFALHNLISGSSPGEFDLILCRNVFLYFAAHSVKHTLQLFERSLTAEGWFVTSTTEIRMVEQSGVFAPQREGHQPVFRKHDFSCEKTPEPPRADSTLSNIAAPPLAGFPTFSEDERLSFPDEPSSPWSPILSRSRKRRLPRRDAICRDPTLPTSLPNTGDGSAGLRGGPTACRPRAVDCARAWCRAAIRDNLRPVEAALLLGVIEQEAGDLGRRGGVPQRVYLDPDNVMAHVISSGFSRRRSRPDETNGSSGLWNCSTARSRRTDSPQRRTERGAAG
jgi:chemotaxis protein methyltransferase CheR